jgi:hypothetical protein
MTQDLGARLIRAGLLSRDDLARAVAVGRADGASTFDALLAGGFPEDTLAGVFVAGGDALLATREELAAADLALVRLVPRDLAESLCALPLRREGDGVVVALADPTNAAARDTLSRLLAATVRLATAPRAAVREALATAWTRDADDDGAEGIDVAVDLDGFFDDDPPVELVRRRTSLPSPATPSLAVGAAVATLPPGATDDELHVPLVRTKPVTVPPTTAPVVHIPASAVPRDVAELLGDSTTVPTSTGPSAKPSGKVSYTPPRPGAILRDPSDLWSSLPPAPPRATSSTAPVAAPPPASTGTLLGHPAPVDVATAASSTSAASDAPDALLAAIRAASSRDDAVRLGCEAAAPAGRCAVFLGLKRDVLQGREASGGGVSRAAAQRLWIPVKSASIFRDAISSGTPHLGSYGTSSADGIFQAAIGSRGGGVVVQPVLVAGKAVAVLCVDGLHEGGATRVERVAGALGEAFERLILSKKA